MSGTNELLVDPMVKQPEQPVVIPGRIQQAARLGMNPELIPRQYLTELLKRAKSTRQSDKRVSKIGHPLLSLMHGLDHYQLGKPCVSDLVIHKLLRNDPDHLATSRKC